MLSIALLFLFSSVSSSSEVYCSLIREIGECNSTPECMFVSFSGRRFPGGAWLCHEKDFLLRMLKSVYFDAPPHTVTDAQLTKRVKFDGSLPLDSPRKIEQLFQHVISKKLFPELLSFEFVEAQKVA